MNRFTEICRNQKLRIMIPKAHEDQVLTMEKETYDLIKGDFTPEEALEVVNDLFLKKINFHNAQIFSQMVRFGTKDPARERRVKELKMAQAKARDLIEEARESGKSIRLNSSISIELI